MKRKTSSTSYPCLEKKKGPNRKDQKEKMEKETILIIEDETDIADLIAMRLRGEGFEVETISHGTQGYQWIRMYHPSLVILDLMLPGMTGLDILKAVRSASPSLPVPILILSAKGEESDVVVGLELGADDYVVKPFSMSVLTARVRALLRRKQNPSSPLAEVLRLGDLELDVECHQVRVKGAMVLVTKTEFSLLLVLLRAHGRVLTRNQLIDKAIGTDVMVTDRTIDVHLTALRAKLGSARDLIETVRGIGYRIAFEKGTS